MLNGRLIHFILIKDEIILSYFKNNSFKYACIIKRNQFDFHKTKNLINSSYMNVLLLLKERRFFRLFFFSKNYQSSAN